MPTFTHLEPGTAEPAWQRWFARQQLPGLDLPHGAHLVVVAAHPDDETLGAGGLAATVASRGGRVDVVVATDGESSHPGSTTTTPAELAVRRGEEVRAAVAELAPDARLHRLQLPDGALADHAAQLRETLDRLLHDGSGEPVLVAAPWRDDRHPDHSAAGEVAAAAASDHGLVLLEYPVWAWHWGDPEAPPFPPSRTQVLPLAAEPLRRKQIALDHHVSQVEPLSAAPGDEVLLPAEVLAQFRRPHETFVVTEPAARRSVPAAFFEEFYADNADDPWGFETRWYERRKRAITLASLPRERFRRAFEPGCSTGLLTVELATRCDEVVAWDVAEPAVEAARRRTASHPHVAVDQRAVPGGWPAGTFDLVLLSEVGYYTAGSDLRELVDRAAGCLADDGVLVACHWRHPVAEHPTRGDDVHAALHAHPRLTSLARHVEEDFVLDVLVPAPATSVARAGGLAP
ncbi:PIG-L family deacetylase [Angustibacter peucedani]